MLCFRILRKVSQSEFYFAYTYSERIKFKLQFIAIVFTPYLDVKNDDRYY